MYDVLSAKIGPTGASVGARMNREKRSKHSKVLGVYFTYVGGKNPWAYQPQIFLVVDICDKITCFKFGDDRFRGLASVDGQILPFPVDFDGRPYNSHTKACAIYRIHRSCDWLSCWDDAYLN